MKLLPELAANEAAEQRVDAGYQAAKAHLQREDQVCAPPGGGAVGVQDPHHYGGVTAHVVGQVKQGKENQRGAQHAPHSEPLLLVMRVGAAVQLHDAAQAAVADGEQREEEAKDGTNEGIRETLLSVAQKYVQGAHGVVAPGAGLDLSHGDNRYAEQQSSSPHHHTQQVSLPPAQQHHGAQRVHDGQVSVHTDAGDEEDAEVEVVVVEQPHSHAERPPQLPVELVQVVVDEVRQGQQP